MPKIDKSQLSKSEWQKIREHRRSEKQKNYLSKSKTNHTSNKADCAFVVGNGVSRKPIEINDLKKFGKIYGCNALYRTHSPDYLIAVDVKMITEINRAGYQNHNEVWTNPNKAFNKFQNFNFFKPSKGWSSGPTALWLASQHGYQTIFILGFDYKGIDDGKKFNNIYADTKNYKKSTDSATFYRNWLRQTRICIEENPKINYKRVISSENFCPDELNRFDNFKNIYVEDFEKIFNLK